MPFLTVRFRISVKKAPRQKKAFLEQNFRFLSKKKDILETKFMISVKKKAPCQKKGIQKRHFWSQI